MGSEKPAAEASLPAVHLVHTAPPDHAQGLDDASLPLCGSLWQLTPAETDQELQAILQECGIMVLLCASLIYLLSCCPL